MTVVSMNFLLEAGVHFGHQKRRWNPKMKEYIYTSRDDIYIIDLQKTQKLIEVAYTEMKAIAENNGTFLFVGTKKQAQEAMEECATRTNQFYINQRWLGGTLTNFKTIRTRIRRIEDIEKMEADGTLNLLPKKEMFQIKKEHAKLVNNLGGIREMKKLPSALIIVDPRIEETAIKEARKLKIPVFGIVDTNCDPDMVDFVIPANDDAVRSVKLVIGVLANAIAEVNGNEIVNYISAEDKTKNAKKEEKAKPEIVTETKPEIKEEKAPEVKEAKEIKEVVTEEKPKKTVKKEVVKVATDLESLTLTELKALAKEKTIKGYSAMKKAELIENLK